MYKYMLCLDKQYDVKWDVKYDRAIVETLEKMLDNMAYLLKCYGVEDEEILDATKDELDIEIEEVEE